MHGRLNRMSFTPNTLTSRKRSKPISSSTPDTFQNKAVYCNCDDPFESNFFKFFAANFNRLRLKKLITTSYDGSPIAGQGTLFQNMTRATAIGRGPRHWLSSSIP